MPILENDKEYYLDRYFLTINNPIDKGFSHEQIISIFKNKFKTFEYLCMADENGSCFHTHVFVSFKGRVRTSMLKHHFKGAHIERCYASTEDNINYIKKTGKWLEDETKQAQVISGSFEEHGIKPKDKKKKSDFYNDLYQMIKDGFTTKEILDSDPRYIRSFDKIVKIQQMMTIEKLKTWSIDERTVIYVYGPPDIEMLDIIYEKYGHQNVYMVSDLRNPFDSYSQEPIIVFDYYSSSFPINDIMKYCNKYTKELPCRFNNKPAYYSTVYILSNQPLEKQYHKLKLNDPASWKKFINIINKIVIYDEDGNTTEYDSAMNYLDRNP